MTSEGRAGSARRALAVVGAGARLPPVRTVLLLLALGLPALAPAAQTGAGGPPDSTASAPAAVPSGPRVRADSVARPEAVFAYGRSVTYRAILAENILLQIAAPDTTVRSTDPTLGLGQLVVDETVSRTGSYFYDVFFRLWNPPADARFLSVVLSEQPLPGQGTLVSVRVDGELVFQGRLTPNEEAAETLARQAVVATLRRLPTG